MIGQTLNNRYRITALVGEGAMGEVYRATDVQTGGEVAVKLLTQKLALEPEMVERFRREAEALRQLRHSNIVGFVDVFAVGKQQAIVMELVPGGSLHHLIQQGPLPVDRVLRIALELCDALARAHHLHIVHRDLKPENVLLAEDGTPKLTDFGVARLVSETTRLTGTGTQMGTPYYMSPEAWEGRELDEQADIWSLGVVLFEMLTGQVPFPGNTLVAVMNKVLTTPPPDLKNLRPETPEELVKIIERMLTRDKARRYPFMREVASDLERVARGETLDQTARKPASPAPRVPRWALGVAGISAALAVMCLVAVGGLWWYTHRAAAPLASQTAPSAGAFSTHGAPVLFAPTATTLPPGVTPTLPTIVQRPTVPPVSRAVPATSSPGTTASAETPAGQAWQNVTAVQSFPAPAASPFLIFRQGDALWVAAGNRLYQLNLQGDIVTEKDFPGSCANATWDGAAVWCTSASTVYQRDLTSEQQLVSFTVDMDSVAGLAWDGAALWVIDGAGNLACYDKSGQRLRRLAVWPHLDRVTGLIWVEREYWVADTFTNVNRFDSQFNLLGYFRLCGASFPYAATASWDGSSLWVADANTNRISQCAPGP